MRKKNLLQNQDLTWLQRNKTKATWVLFEDKYMSRVPGATTLWLEGLNPGLITFSHAAQLSKSWLLALLYSGFTSIKFLHCVSFFFLLFSSEDPLFVTASCHRIFFEPTPTKKKMDPEQKITFNQTRFSAGKISNEKKSCKQVLKDVRKS